MNLQTVMRKLHLLTALFLASMCLSVSPALANTTGCEVLLHKPDFHAIPGQNVKTPTFINETTMYSLYQAKNALARKASSHCVTAGSAYMNNECEAANGASCNCEDDCDCEADEDSCECDCGGILPWQ